MKKRQLATILLLWLFSQQLFVAVSSTMWSTMAHTSKGCNAYSHHDVSFKDSHGKHQSDCTLITLNHQGHDRHGILSTDTTERSVTQSVMCDHCSATCQLSPIFTSVLSFSPFDHLPFTNHSIDTPIDITLTTLYRPPILV